MKRQSMQINLFGGLLLLTLLAGCGGPRSAEIPSVAVPTPVPVEDILAPLTGSGDVKRSLLTYDDLMDGFDAQSPVDERAFALPGDAAPAEKLFVGRLELVGEADGGDIAFVRGGDSWTPEEKHLPAFDFEFVQAGSYLVPVQRGQIITTHPTWNYLLEPGRIWREKGDQGFARASFPFVIIPKGGNAVFNGVMSFLFDGERVSRVWYQITQETTTFSRANFWGLLEAKYHPGVSVDVDDVRDAFGQEMARRFPTKPIGALAVDYPGVNLAVFGSGVSPEHMTWYGFVINGVNYTSGCRTRYGQYAYCEWMRATSYSTAKSAFASVALMRLAQENGPEVAQLLVRDYVPEAAEDSIGDWRLVTFDHTLDMATGNYRSSGYMVDEDGETMNVFFGSQPYAQRMAAALVWPHSSEPGVQWVYKTSDTFIVTRAMHNYLQELEGADADIFRYVVDEVYRPIGIGPGAHTSMRTADDNWQGQAEGGYGLWWIQDDIAKITGLLMGGGTYAGEQILHPDLLADALQQDPQDRGVAISPGRMYNNAFWASEYGPAQGYDCTFWVTQMLGVSGNVVALMPNGSVYYYFSDNQEFTWDMAVRESDRIKPHCP